MGFLEKCKEWFQYYSVRLAAAVAAVAGLLVENKEVLFSLITFIPSDPTHRANMTRS